MKSILPVLLVLALAACGNKGPLVLADPPKAADEPASPMPAPSVDDTTQGQAAAPDPAGTPPPAEPPKEPVPGNPR